MYTDNISNIANYMASRSSSQNIKTPEEVKSAFEEIFYKEILKQTFKSQNSFLGGDDESFFPRGMSQDYLIDKFAEALAKNNQGLLKKVAVENGD